MTKVQYLNVLGGVAALALLAGCGQSQPKEEAATTETPAAEAVAEAPAAEAPAAEAPAAVEPTPVAATENFADFTGTATAGKVVFTQCMACHVQTEGVNRVGPSLHNIVGRESGTVAGFNYSKANQDSDLVWTEAELFDYLRNPQKKIPGTKMAFAGIPDPQKRADLIAFLKVNGQI